MDSDRYDELSDMQTLSIKQVAQRITPLISSHFEKHSDYFKSLDALNMADLGCATGNNTKEQFRLIYSLFSKINPKSSLILTLSDLESNNFQITYNNFLTQMKVNDNIYHRFVMGSFFKQNLPPNSTDIITCNTAIHWLEGMNDLILNETSILPEFASEENIRKNAIQMAEDNYLEFLKSREKELKNNGLLIISGPLNSEPITHIQLLLKCWKLTVEKLNVEKLLKYMTLKVYFRTEEELLDPVKKNKVNFELVKIEIINLHYESTDFAKDTKYFLPFISYNLRMIVNKFYEKEYGKIPDEKFKDDLYTIFFKNVEQVFKAENEKMTQALVLEYPVFCLVLKKIDKCF